MRRRTHAMSRAAGIVGSDRLRLDAWGMRIRWLPLFLLAVLAATLPACQVFYGIAKFTGLMSPPKFSARGEIPQDFQLSVDTKDYANPPTDYTIVLERTGKVSYDVVVRTPHRREQQGTFEVTEEQVRGLWKAVAEAKFDELDERYPSSGVGKDKAQGVRKWFVRADGVERRVEAHYQTVPAMDSIRAAFIAVVPKDIMDAHDAMVGKNTTGEFVGDTVTHLFHLPDCPALKDVPAQRQQRLKSQYEALDYNFQPCPDCSPLKAKSR